MFIDQPAQPEVQDLQELGLGIENEVVRLDIAMDNALLLGIRQPGRGLAHVAAGAANRQGASPAMIWARLAVDRIPWHIRRWTAAA